MISIRYLFEQPNVPNAQANGLTAPFGSFVEYQAKNKATLAQAQDMTKMNAEEQKNFMIRNKIIDVGNFPDF